MLFSRVMSVKKIIVHWKYNAFEFTHDYAIIQLTERISFSPVANAACLPSFSDITTTDGKMMTISGWGFVELSSDYEYIEATVLQKAMIQGKFRKVKNKKADKEETLQIPLFENPTLRILCNGMLPNCMGG